MIILLSHPEQLENEASLINQLFEAGMPIFHLRKPSATEQEVKTIIQHIKPEYRARVVLNQFYNLSEEFAIHRFHFSTDKRNKGEHTNWKKEGNVLSTSTHSEVELNSLEAFDYAFLSPVFESITKPGYKNEALQFTTSSLRKQKVIALGGINADHCTELKERGFDGIGLLGAIWQNEHPVESYKKIAHVWNTHDQ